VDQIGAKLAQKAAAIRQAYQRVEWILAHSHVDNREIGGPLLGDRRAQNQKSDRVPALGHAPRQRQHYTFRSAHAQ
jgi:hypothetical protein